MLKIKQPNTTILKLQLFYDHKKVKTIEQNKSKKITIEQKVTTNDQNKTRKNWNLPTDS